MPSIMLRRAHYVAIYATAAGTVGQPGDVWQTAPALEMRGKWELRAAQLYLWNFLRELHALNREAIVDSDRGGHPVTWALYEIEREPPALQHGQRLLTVPDMFAATRSLHYQCSWGERYARTVACRLLDRWTHAIAELPGANRPSNCYRIED